MSEPRELLVDPEVSRAKFDRELKVAVDEAKKMMKSPETPKVVQ